MKFLAKASTKRNESSHQPVQVCFLNDEESLKIAEDFVSRCDVSPGAFFIARSFCKKDHGDPFGDEDYVEKAELMYVSDKRYAPWNFSVLVSFETACTLLTGICLGLTLFRNSVF